MIRSEGSCMERGGTTRHCPPDPAETLRDGLQCFCWPTVNDDGVRSR